jgi:hypothetical protein
MIIMAWPVMARPDDAGKKHRGSLRVVRWMREWVELT